MSQQEPNLLQLQHAEPTFWFNFSSTVCAPSGIIIMKIQSNYFVNIFDVYLFTFHLPVN